MLLESVGVPLLVRPTDADEAEAESEAPRAYCLRVAREKALAANALDPVDGAALRVLAADTTVALGAWIPGKPGTPGKAIETLSRLSGQWHQVHTAVVLRTGHRLRSCIVTTRVRFRALTLNEISAYVATGEPLDRAGGYAIQGGGGALVDRVVGSYTAVVGLPLRETLRLIGWEG
jgi:septum formation protein